MSQEHIPNNDETNPENAEQQAHERRHAIISWREHKWYPEAKRMGVLKELKHLITDPRRHRARSLAIVADANGGKTLLIKRLVAEHAPRDGEEAQEIPVFMLSMADISRVEDLSTEFLRKLGAPDPKAGTHADRMTRFLDLAKRVKLRMIILDEFHDCVGAKGKGTPFLRLIKALMNRGILVVPVGTPALIPVLKRDPQLASRFNFARGTLGRLEDAGTVKAVMMHVSQLPKEQISDAAVTFVFEETKGILGHVLDLAEQTMLVFGNLKLASLREVRTTMDVLDDLV